MPGVIAAGSIPTAEAGAAVLAAGGNAVDAAVAACFAVNAGEPTLTSLAAGGVMMHRDGATGAVTVVDCFADAPPLRAEEVEGYDFDAIELDYGPVKQVFHIGAGSAAVPGILPGLLDAAERWGSLPLSDLVAPACRMLREGAIIGPAQARLARLLEPILVREAATRAIFAPGGRYLAAGHRFVNPALAETLEALAAGGGRAWYDAELCPAMARDFGPAAGGLFTAEACAGYRVELRDPLTVKWRGHTLHLMPPPAVGGGMIGLMLDLLSDGPPPDVRSAHGLRRLAAAMAVADGARRDAALGPDAREALRRRFNGLVAGKAPLGAPRMGGGPPSTTHVSAIDGAGNACAITFSHGESNGRLIGESGIVMNNLLGEEDLHPEGFGKAPVGERLATMMSPTLMQGPGGGLVALGTGGANRIRTALLQAVVRLAGFDDDVRAAIDAPRMHFEGGTLSLEVFEGHPPLAGLAREVVEFAAPHLFFGGVHTARMAADGALDGAGDARRGGVCRVVR